MSAEDQNAELEETVTETAETCSDEVRLDEEEAKDDSPSAPDGEAAKEPTRMMLLRQLLFPRASEITGDLATTSIISTLVALVFSVVWVVAIIASVAILV